MVSSMKLNEYDNSDEPNSAIRLTVEEKNYKLNIKQKEK